MSALRALVQRLAANPAKVAKRYERAPEDSQESQVSQRSDAEARADLLELARAELPDRALIHRLPDADIELCAALPKRTLRAYVRALADSALREQGKRPDDETARGLCVTCGPVWLEPNVARVVPVIAGWPTVVGCPWCLVRKAGRYLPRPTVTCGECAHFVRDTINPDEGMGSCGAGCEPSRLYPNVNRCCASMRPSSSAILDLE